MKNKFFIILLAGFLLMPVYAVAEDTATSVMPVTQEETEKPLITDTASVNINTEEKVTATQEANETYKKPISKRKIAKKFLLAMFGVGISSLIVFLGLMLYNKIRRKIVNQVKTPDGEIPLQSPDDYDSAVRIFLDKTKWK